MYTHNTGIAKRYHVTERSSITMKYDVQGAWSTGSIDGHLHTFGVLLRLDGKTGQNPVVS